MKTLMKLTILAVGFYATTSMAMTKKECESGGGTYTATNSMTGTCTQKITAIKQPNVPIVQITKEECKAQGGTVSNGNCITVTRFITAQTTRPSATK